MAKRTTYHVTKNKGDGWNVKKAGGQRSSRGVKKEGDDKKSNN